MKEDESLNRSYPEEVRILDINGREFILVGTAHVSQQSAELVREVITNERPDCVCVELDAQRHKSLSEQNRWESLDLRAIIRQKQLSTLIINLLLASYQKKLGDQLGVMPGVELLEATKVAGEQNIPVALCDRDIRVTLRRAWHLLSFWKKMELLAIGLAGIFEKQEISEEKLSELRRKDMLSELIAELGKAMPVLKTVLIDERDAYLAQKIKAAEGEKIVAVVGAGHLEGISKALAENQHRDLREIEQIPPASPAWKWIGWSIPALVLGSIFYIGWTRGIDTAGHSIFFWILATGLPSALGTLLAWGHPVTVLSALLGAPITTLSPAIGVGYVAALVQAYLRPPVVKEFQSVREDVRKFKKWWQNKLLRVLLVFIFSSLGGAIGMYFGSYKIVSALFQ